MSDISTDSIAPAAEPASPKPKRASAKKAPSPVLKEKAAARKTTPAEKPPVAATPSADTINAGTPAKPSRKPRKEVSLESAAGGLQPELPLLTTPEVSSVKPRRNTASRKKVPSAKAQPTSPTDPESPPPTAPAASVVASTESLPSAADHKNARGRRPRREASSSSSTIDSPPFQPAETTSLLPAQAAPDASSSKPQNESLAGPPPQTHSQEQRPSEQRPSRPDDNATGTDESNRSRRWKERRNRFKKWKERRRSGPPGGPSDSTEPSELASESSGHEASPPPVLLGPPEPVDGILELTPKGYGFLRQRSRAFSQFPQDPFVSPDLIRQFGLREGMFVKGKACKAPRGPQVTEIEEVNNRAPEAMRELPLFEELKAVNPSKRIQLETDKNRLTTRVIDMITPVGRGQRGLIVAPPRTGKTTLLQHIAEAVVLNHPNIHLMLLLVDERPEEVTEFKRVLPNAEIFASSNDQDVKSHTRIATFAIERAKRLVECGEHVFILMDSITRLARAFNNAKQGGATMSGGVGVGALEIPRRLFAAARNTREAGSLTILATALIETGSRMDDLIFQEFKGTGNMELVLDRKIAEQFYYPAVNIFKSGTRREELLLQPFQLDKIHMLRRGLAGHKPIEALQRVLSLLERYPSNAQMMVDLPSKS